MRSASVWAFCFVVSIGGVWCGRSAEGQAKERLLFYAMGDVPYQPAEDELLRKQIAELPTDGALVMHVGDIKTGATICEEAIYVKVAGMLAASKTPVFIIPGDNEWNDCVDPAKGWEWWNRHFMRFDQRWPHRLPVYRPLDREENFSMVIGGVLVIGVNVVGGLVHDSDEWRTRHRQCAQCVQQNVARFGSQVSSLVLFGHATPTEKQKDFFEPLNALATGFAKPVLYLHGDGHKWIHDRPFPAKNILRVQIDQGGIAPPLKVTVTDHASEPFVFDRRLPAAP